MRHEQLSINALTVNKINGSMAPVFSGVSAAETDADNSVVITQAGVLATDFATAVLVAGAAPQAVTKVVCTANTITVTLAGNGGAGTQVFYKVFR